MNIPGLDIIIQANADQLLAAINQATAKIEELGKKINSLPSGDKQFNKLSRELARTTITQQNLIKSYEKLGTEAPPVTQKVEQFTNSSRSARIAVSSLSVAIQDLPFGFIGIQNNLPAIIQSFGNLKTETNGLKGFFEALKGQLIGPGGLFLAFSAGTAIITSLIQKYGSLGNALDALFGKIDVNKKRFEELTKSYEEFNKNAKSSNDITDNATASTEAQILKVQTLSKALTDTSKSYLSKQLALQELKKISDDYFGSLSLKGDGLKNLTDLTNKYTQSILNQALAKGYEDEIVETTKEFNKQNRELLGIVKNLPAEYKRINDLTKANKNSVTDFGGAINKYVLAEGDRDAATKLVNQKYFDQARIVSDLRLKLDDLKKVFTELTIENLDNSVLDPVKIKKVKDEYKDLFQKLPARSAEYIKFLKEANKLTEDNIELNKRIRIAVTDVGGPMANDLKSPFLPDKDDIKFYEDALKSFESITQKYNDRIFGIFNRTLRQPIEDLFNTLLTTGKIAWADFGNAVVSVLKRIAAQLIATGIASLIANILAPGAGIGVSAGLKGISTGALGDFLSVGGGANFGGVGPGGLAMTGAVSLSLRGSDLVGAINRTNTNINRIG
jgi:hypothetical protein